MEHTNTVYQVGNATITKIPELVLDAVPPSFLYPEASLLPVIEAGLTREILVNGQEVIEGFSYLPSPGHSIDHACISFTSQGEHALFWGDVMHTPLQFARPDWNSAFCEFPDAACQARRWAVNHAADRGALVLTTHFAQSSAGRVTRDGDVFAWQFT